MENVVYILGAGFSAPLGLPLMRDFIFKAKDMYALQAERYAHFSQVFKTLRELDGCKHYYESNLFDVEEVLSILEMRDTVTDGKERKALIQFVRDVIQHYTPKPPATVDEVFTRNWREAILSTDQKWMDYIYFAANLLNASLAAEFNPSSARLSSLIASRVEKPVAKYSVITLNYDLVLEHAAIAFTIYIGSMSGRLWA